MSKVNHSEFTRLLLLACSLFLLAACSDSDDPPLPADVIDDGTDGGSDDGSGGGSGDDTGDAGGAPEGVLVVSGDSDSSEVQNTISWALGEDGSEYTVYWDNAAGVTDASSVVVPAAEGFRYVVHAGAEVLAGSEYYYRVQAITNDTASALSDEVLGTPQLSITGSQLNDVAWNGVDKLVAVGDSGIILVSPNALADGWTDVSSPEAPQQLAGVTWDGVNSQFLIVGAGNTVLSGDGLNWSRQDLGNLAVTSNLQDVAWLGDRYIAVGNNGAIISSNADGSAWVAQDAGPDVGNTSFNAVATNGDRIVVVGGNGTVISSVDAVTWELQTNLVNNDLNDVTWDGSQYVIAGSNDTVLTSPDGLTWTTHIPGTSDINFVAVTQWDAGLPATPVLGVVGSSGTFVIGPANDPGVIVPTGTNQQIGGMTWVEAGDTGGYFVMVGNDGTVLTARYE
jgi:photosystem II stability/assembly factor-like uncharacterized protein